MTSRSRPVAAPSAVTDSTAGSASAPAAFSVVLPVFDEEEGLLAVLDGLRAALRGVGRPYEIVVVDDGSTDGTARILSACTGITIVRHEHNRGYGAALKAGVQAASHFLVVVMDADGTYAPAAIPALVARCDAADMVVGARLGQQVQPTPARSAVKWCFRQFAQWITASRIPDLNSGLRVFRRTVAERFVDLLPDGFSFTTTITVAALLERLVVCFEVVDYLPRIGRSKVRPVRDTARIARQLLRLGLRLAPLRTSLAFAVPLALVGVGSLGYHRLEVGRAALADASWLVAAGILVAIGLAAEQRVRKRRGRAAAKLVASPRLTT